MTQAIIKLIINHDLIISIHFREIHFNIKYAKLHLR